MGNPEPEVLYFEDVELNEDHESGNYVLTRDEIIEFASKWDPQPFHIDEEQAKASVFGGFSACSAHLFAIMAKLLFERGNKMKMIAGLGTESMRLLAPGRPGDQLRVRHSVIEKRESKSRPTTGIVRSKVELVNQKNEVVVETIASALIGKRNQNGD